MASVCICRQGRANFCLLWAWNFHRRLDATRPRRSAVHRWCRCAVCTPNHATCALDRQLAPGIRRLHARPRHQRPARRHRWLRSTAGFWWELMFYVYIYIHLQSSIYATDNCVYVCVYMHYVLCVSAADSVCVYIYLLVLTGYRWNNAFSEMYFMCGGETSILIGVGLLWIFHQMDTTLFRCRSAELAFLAFAYRSRFIFYIWFYI